jgi:ribosomal protein L11 methyltransferase
LQINPYSQLYIYYLKGRLASETIISSEFFIGNWEEDGYSFLFFSKPCPEDIENMLVSQSDLTLLDKYHMTYDQWLGEKFTGFQAGRFIVVPPWNDREVEKTRIKIVLDPGLVFGTGTHPTTRDCMQALEFVFENESIQTALDLGMGTGLLSLAAAKLGGGKILALDNNRLAAMTALRNVHLNELDKQIYIIQGDAGDWIDCPVDLLMANIHYDVMKRLILSKGFSNKKWFILSGLLRSEARDAITTLSRYSPKILKFWNDDGIWHTFCGKIG